MRRAMIISWLFVLMVATYDCWFMWQNQATAMEWELNPIARSVLIHFGVWSLFAMKGITIAFAVMAIARCKTWVADAGMAVIVAQHCVLVLVYLSA